MELLDELYIEFKKPITFEKRTVEGITLEEPTIGQIEEANKRSRGKDNLANTRELIAVVTGETNYIISQMKIRDIKKAGDFLASFLEDPKPKKEEDESLEAIPTS